MEVAGPLGTPLGLAQRKRASPRGEAGTSGFLCVSDSGRIPGKGQHGGLLSMGFHRVRHNCTLKKVNTKIQQDAATAVHGKNFTAYANKERSQINGYVSCASHHPPAPLCALRPARLALPGESPSPLPVSLLPLDASPPSPAPARSGPGGQGLKQGCEVRQVMLMNSWCWESLPPQDPSPLRGTLASSLRSPATFPHSGLG